MTEIFELIEAAEKALKAWKKPCNDSPPKRSRKDWQQLMDDRLYQGRG